jgi:hypothetical protein
MGVAMITTEHYPTVKASVRSEQASRHAGAFLAYRPVGSPNYLLYGDDAVAAAIVSGVPPGWSFHLASDPSVLAVPCGEIRPLAALVRRQSGKNLIAFGTGRGCGPDWFEGG